MMNTNRHQGVIVAASLLLMSFGTQRASADGGASAAVVIYIKAEAANIARQAAQGWFVSYGPEIRPNGDFFVTFKNEIRYGFGLGKETWWVDVRGNLATGQYGVKGRGSDIVSWIDFYSDAVGRAIGDWSRQWRAGQNGSPPPAGGQGLRLGQLLVNNNYGGVVEIRLYHPQAANRIFATWRFGGTERSMLACDNQRITVGSDWGIQIVFGNGVTSPIRYVGDIATHNGQTFEVLATRILGG